MGVPAVTDYRCHACDRDVRLLPHRRLPDGRLTCRRCDVMPRCPAPGCPWRWRDGDTRAQAAPHGLIG
jgi:hypothetical protein